MRDSLTW